MPSLKIQISIPDSLAGELKDYSVRGESPSQTARRLLIDLLNNGLPEGIPQSVPQSVPDDLGDRLEKIERHLDWAKREILDGQKKIKEIDHDLYWGSSLAFQEIKKDITWLKSTALNHPEGDRLETAIMIQKKPLELAPTPTEITLTHDEAAGKWDKTPATIKRWAKDPDKWPDGWLWDSDRNFWVKPAQAQSV